MYNICRILKKAQMIENLSEISFQIVYKISHDSTTHNLRDFLRESGKMFLKTTESPHWLMFVVFVHFAIFTIKEMSSFINSVRW